MIIPSESIRYILFQRTAYLQFPNTFIYRLLDRALPFSIYNRFVENEAKKTDRSRISALYENDMKKEYLSIKDSLPKTCSSVLDIGCGVAGIDVFLNRHYQDQPSVFYLLDKTSVEKSVFYNFSSTGAFYNSLDIAKKVLLLNGIPEKSVHLLEANDDHNIEMDGSVDLVISLISWGFHYPVETYLDKVYTLLNNDGSMIIDVRKGTNGIHLIENIFNRVSIIYDAEKHQRVLAIK